MNAFHDWWHIAHSPTTIHAHHLPPEVLLGAARQWQETHLPEPGQQAPTLQEAVAEAAGAYAQAIRDGLGFPTDWFNAPGWTSMLSPGTPHEKLLVRVCPGCDLPAHAALPEPSWPA